MGVGMSRRMGIRVGDCVEVMRGMDEGSVDAIVTDPPYELGFMGKKWDGTGIAHTPEVWRECYRVLKPGGHLLSFGGTRTYHRMASAVEDAGFEIRDMIQWLYGQGFPKSMNVGKQVDGWDGWGTALKPANEPIVLARKFFKGTVAKNVLAHGTGALNIDGTRIAHQSEADRESAFPGGRLTSHGKGHLAGPGDAQQIERSGFETERAEGRWPANVILDPEAGVLLDEQVGILRSGGTPPNRPADKSRSVYGEFQGNQPEGGVGSSEGGPSRFFYCAKASKSERNAGLDHLEDKRFAQSHGGQTDVVSGEERYADEGIGLNKVKVVKNNHPTVKPIALMRYLCRLITPPGGLILDPFAGSGTTGIAARLGGFDFMGIEIDPEYAQLARARIRHWVEA